ncbi:hypothetical protein NEMIN01_0654 [Nematocida minor]|uniref:uncharacterized protein n=1 Tax=Nematocida minor TaxID=1912983 RepID=UPI00221E979C|nr:uncharacterized protein NEMIN01_0654 [Nematocida minor]KAI5189701.1 hypothetical protein NEMIN01_0654 [Nematocida minor]
MIQSLGKTKFTIITIIGVAVTTIIILYFTPSSGSENNSEKKKTGKSPTAGALQGMEDAAKRTEAAKKPIKKSPDGKKTVKKEKDYSLPKPDKTSQLAKANPPVLHTIEDNSKEKVEVKTQGLHSTTEFPEESKKEKNTAAETDTSVSAKPEKSTPLNINVDMKDKPMKPIVPPKLTIPMKPISVPTTNLYNANTTDPIRTKPVDAAIPQISPLARPLSSPPAPPVPPTDINNKRSQDVDSKKDSLIDSPIEDVKDTDTILSPSLESQRKEDKEEPIAYNKLEVDKNTDESNTDNAEQEPRSHSEYFTKTLENFEEMSKPKEDITSYEYFKRTKGNRSSESSNSPIQSPSSSPPIKPNYELPQTNFENWSTGKSNSYIRAMQINEEVNESKNMLNAPDINMQSGKLVSAAEKETSHIRGKDTEAAFLHIEKKIPASMLLEKHQSDSAKPGEDTLNKSSPVPTTDAPTDGIEESLNYATGAEVAGNEEVTKAGVEVEVANFTVQENATETTSKNPEKTSSAADMKDESANKISSDKSALASTGPLVDSASSLEKIAIDSGLIHPPTEKKDEKMQQNSQFSEPKDSPQGAYSSMQQSKLKEDQEKTKEFIKQELISEDMTAKVYEPRTYYEVNDKGLLVQVTDL